LQEFDNQLYEREDLQWIAENYLAVLQFAWDADVYSATTASYGLFRDFFHRNAMMNTSTGVSISP
jgi:hypothetical protein